MTCRDVQNNLSLYLYGELDFAREEEFEHHLVQCAYCQLALAREKAWQTALNSEQADVPLDLLADCRRDLRDSIGQLRTSAASEPAWRRWLASFHVAPSRWSPRLAAASFLVLLGFGAGRLAEQTSLARLHLPGNTAEMGVLGPYSRVREIRTDESGRVRLVVDEVREQEVVGALDDQNIRHVLLAAMQDAADPAVRVDSVEILTGQTGSDIRDALLESVRRDPNPAVRLKAVEGLRRFTEDTTARQALKDVLEHDDNAGVRSEAIDVLLPASERIEFSPDLANMLKEVMQYERSDEYVRMRCWQAMHQMRAAPDVY
jgi:hypothetical protein